MIFLFVFFIITALFIIKLSFFLHASVPLFKQNDQDTVGQFMSKLCTAQIICLHVTLNTAPQM